MRSFTLALRSLFVAAYLLAPLAPAATLRPGDILVVARGDLGFSPGGPANGAVFLVDPNSGDRTILSGRGVGIGPELRNPVGITLAPNGSIYVADHQYDLNGLAHGVVLQIDPSTGGRTEISGPSTGSGPSLEGGTSLGALDVIASTGDGFLYLTNRYQASIGQTTDGTVWRIDPVSGDREIVSGAGIGSGPVLEGPLGITMGPDGSTYVADTFSGLIQRVDLMTGSRSPIANAGESVLDIVVLADGSLVYTRQLNPGVSRYFPDSDVTVTLSGLQGGITVGPPVDPEGVADAGTGTIYVGGLDGVGAAIVAIDVDTLEWRVVSSNSEGSGPLFEVVSFLAVVPVPEPSTLALAALGAMGLLVGARGRHRRRHGSRSGKSITVVTQKGTLMKRWNIAYLFASAALLQTWLPQAHATPTLWASHAPLPGGLTQWTVYFSANDGAGTSAGVTLRIQAGSRVSPNTFHGMTQIVDRKTATMNNAKKQTAYDELTMDSLVDDYVTLGGAFVDQSAAGLAIDTITQTTYAPLIDASYDRELDSWVYSDPTRELGNWPDRLPSIFYVDGAFINGGIHGLTSDSTKAYLALGSGVLLGPRNEFGGVDNNVPIAHLVTAAGVDSLVVDGQLSRLGKDYYSSHVFVANPEPGTLVLAVLGALALVTARRKLRRSSSLRH